MLNRLGWTIVVAPGMRDAGCLVESQRIALFSDALTPETRAATGALLLSLALDHDLLSVRPH